MKLPRPFRRITALIALFGILLMQVAYACPEIGMPQPAPMAAMSMPAGPSLQGSGCEETGKMQPSLCPTQTHAVAQSLDKPATPDVQPFVPASLTTTVEPVAPRTAESVVSSHPPLLARITAPPLSVRHCCFRI